MKIKLTLLFLLFSILKIQSCSIIDLSSNISQHGKHFLSMTSINNKTQNICKSGVWELAKGGLYNPASTASGNPMIKVCCSHTELNFDGNYIENIDSTNAGWIGIEVGFSPTELQADSTLRQPKNIIINNVHLRNFDCGILIHKSVERVIINESTIYDCSIGMVLLGDENSLPNSGSQFNFEQIKQVSIINCKIIGHGQNKRTALVNLKTIIETDYGYSTDLFMPMRADRLNSNLLDVYGYSGILATEVRNLNIECIDIQSIGNSDFTTEGNTTRTEAIGILLRDCDKISIKNSKVTETTGNVKAIGLQLQRCYDVKINDSIFSYGKSDYIACGIETFPDYLAQTVDGITPTYDYTVEEIDLENIKTEFQRSDQYAVGIYLTDVRGLNGENITGERNIGGTGVYGTISYNCVDINFTNSSFTRNFAGSYPNLRTKKRILFGQNEIKRNFGNLGTNDGDHAIGFYGENCINGNFESAKFDQNEGANTARGIHLYNCQNINFKNSSFSNNKSTDGFRTNEETELLAAQDANEISRLAPVRPEASTGGYGLVAESNCANLNFEYCKANQNSGHRTIGFCFKDCTDYQLNNVEANGQSSTGTILTESIKDLDATDVTFLEKHINLFASKIYGTTPVITDIDRIQFDRLLYDSLNNAREIEEDIIRTGITFAEQQYVLTAISLMHASMARFRLWGIAYGIHCHNSKRFSIKNSTASYQKSEEDNSAGIITSGRSEEFEIDSCDLSNNQGWTKSKQAIWENSLDSEAPRQRYQYDLSAMKFFWYFAARTYSQDWGWAANDQTIGFRTDTTQTGEPTVLIAQGEQTFGVTFSSGSYPYIEPRGTSMRNLINLFGPMTAGLIISDLGVFGKISNNIINNNFGHSGQGYGILIQHGHNHTITNNEILSNGANVYGWGWGIFDLGTFSSSNYLRNYLGFNKIKNCVNANTLIPMQNVTDNTLQLDSIESGAYNYDIRTMHNLEITFPYNVNDPYQPAMVESSLDGSLQPELIDLWTTESWIS